MYWQFSLTDDAKLNLQALLEDVHNERPQQQPLIQEAEQ